MNRTLIVLPDDGVRPIVSAIERAARSLRVKMFAFSDSTLLKAVIAAKHRHVDVRVVLNAARRNGDHDNDATRQVLVRAGVKVKSGNPAFDLTHEKSMVVDDEQAFIQSMNWTTKNVTETRDYAVITTHRQEVAEVIAGFEADWHRRPFEPEPGSHLVWCPGPGRERLCAFIDEARHRLFVQNERFQDLVIVERLIRASQRGVKVQVMARPPHTLKRDKLVEGVGGLRIMDDVGIKIHRLKHVKLHGKMLLADDARAIVGSINFAAGSLDGRRELAIEVRDDDVVERLGRIAHHDWDHSRPLDLSDEGLLADLEDRIDDSPRLLGIEHDRDSA